MELWAEQGSAARFQLQLTEGHCRAWRLSHYILKVTTSISSALATPQPPAASSQVLSTKFDVGKLSKERGLRFRKVTL